VRVAHVAPDAVAGVDVEGDLEREAAARVELGEFPAGSCSFARFGDLEIRIETVERRLAFHLDRPGPAHAEDRLVASGAELKLLELLEILDRGADDGRVAPRQRADADRGVGVRVDLLRENAALQRVAGRPLE